MKKAAKGEMAGMKTEDYYKAECDANDLMRAEEIKSDKKRLAKALEHVGKKAKSFSSLLEMKEYAYNPNFKPKYEKDEMDLEDDEDES